LLVCLLAGIFFALVPLRTLVAPLLHRSSTLALGLRVYLFFLRACIFMCLYLYFLVVYGLPACVPGCSATPALDCFLSLSCLWSVCSFVCLCVCVSTRPQQIGPFGSDPLGSGPLGSAPSARSPSSAHSARPPWLGLLGSNPSGSRRLRFPTALGCSDAWPLWSLRPSHGCSARWGSLAVVLDRLALGSLS
jgi:hypothetical protein